MEAKIATKQQLKRLNRIATKANATSVVDEFFQQLRSDLRYIVRERLPLERGWMRCMVIYAHTPKPRAEDMQHVLIDIQETEFEKLPDAVNKPGIPQTGLTNLELQYAAELQTTAGSENQ